MAGNAMSLRVMAAAISVVLAAVSVVRLNKYLKRQFLCGYGATPFRIHMCGGLILNPLANRRKRRRHYRENFKAFMPIESNLFPCLLPINNSILFIKDNMIQHQSHGMYFQTFAISVSRWPTHSQLKQNLACMMAVGIISCILFSLTFLPMPVLHRWDENDDVVAKPTVWRRYDETESGNDSEGGSSETEPPS